MLNRFWRILLLATLKDTSSVRARPSVTPSGRMAFASPPPFYETVTTTMPSDAAPSAAMLSRSYQSAAAAAALAHAAPVHPSVRRPLIS